MRIGIKTSNEFINSLNTMNEKIQDLFLERVKNLTKMIDVKVMLRDSTVIEQKTFDPAQVRIFFENITKKITGWEIQDVTITNNEDIRRIFTKFETKIGNYLLTGHLSIQFHILLYYRPDHKVIEYQKELSEIIDKTKATEKNLADESDQLILTKLKKMGYTDLDHQKLFEVFFEDDQMCKNIFSEIEGQTGLDFQKLSDRKLELFNELDSLLLETYQTSPILIDDARLVTGEEGCLCTFDLEFIKGKNKEGLFNPRKVPKDIQIKIMKKFEEIYEIM